MASDDQENKRLMRLVADGDRAAFATLHRRVYAQVYRFSLRMVRTPDRAEEGANDTMVAVWSSAARFEHRSKVSTWIFGVAYRTALKSLKRHRFERRHVDIDAMPDQLEYLIRSVADDKLVGPQTLPLPQSLD